MPSLVPGYEYDIFISYRHKDNKYDGWVTTFVENLRRELESTFKDEIFIYFDENAHDGLQANHDVDDSLRDKVRVLIFLPVLSRTYCDENSFAWRKEFLGFRDFVLTDPLGLKVKLANANVTSRVLPIRIHDLDSEDVQLFEKEVKSVLRPIDFIFKSSGVNRPLEPHDDRKENQNHIYYRDQINKVAMAVKEIMMAVRQSSLQGATSEVINKVASTPVRDSRKRYAIPLLIIALLALIGYGAMSVLGSKKGETNIEDVAADIDRSIAVLPFANMSADKEQEYFSDGLSEEVLNVLSKVPDMKVISRTSAFSFKGKNEDIRAIGEKLGVAYLLEGSVRKAADKIRITAQLVKASDGSHLWSETFDRGMDDVFKVQDEIASAVVAALKLKLLGSNQGAPRESNPEVYNLWMQSRYYVRKFTSEGRKKGFEFAQLAVNKDSTDARAWAQLSDCYRQNSNLYTDHEDVNKTLKMALKAAEKAISLDTNLADGHMAKATVLNDIWEISEALKYGQKALDLDSSSNTLTFMAHQLLCLGDFTKAKILSNKAISRDPLYATAYSYLSLAFMQEGNYRLAIETSKKAIELQSDAGMHRLVESELLDNNPKAALQLVPRIEDEYWKEYFLIVALWGDDQHQASQAELRKFEKKYKEVGPCQIAEIYSWYGEYNKTFEWLEQAFKYRDPGLLQIKFAPFMKPLWKDPRYQAVLKRLNLPVD